MTNDERIALLRKVAEVAPKEMEPGFEDCTNPKKAFAWFDGVAFDECVMLDLSGDDIEDAAAIIAMLNAMEKVLESGVVLTSGGGLLKGKYSVKFGGWDQALPMSDTRAEAVARAFVRVFGGD